MNQPTHHQIATYLTDHALSELVRYVMEDTGCSIEQAMEKVYNSPLMELLQDEDNELYVQSPAYLYELMNKDTKNNNSLDCDMGNSGATCESIADHLN